MGTVELGIFRKYQVLGHVPELSDPQLRSKEFEHFNTADLHRSELMRKQHSFLLRPYFFLVWYVDWKSAQLVQTT